MATCITTPSAVAYTLTSTQTMATLLLYGALIHYAIALPAPCASDIGLGAVTSVIDKATTPDTPAFDTNYRSTLEIVWSCLTVIIASSWLCVHPNVTGHSTAMWQRLRERLILFGLALFAPEVMAVFAYYQWMGCRKLYRKFKERAEGLNISTSQNVLPEWAVAYPKTVVFSPSARFWSFDRRRHRKRQHYQWSG